MRWMLPLCLVIAACDRGPEVPTSAENRDLDEAGNLLDQAEDNLSGIDTGAVEDRDPAP